MHGPTHKETKKVSSKFKYVALTRRGNINFILMEFVCKILSSIPYKNKLHQTQTFTMTTHNTKILILVIWLHLSTSTTTTFVKHDNYDHHLPIVHVTRDLPKNSPTMEVVCKFNNGQSLGVQKLKAGDDYTWNVKLRVVYYCQAIWGNRVSSWHAYQPRRDANHGRVFWLVKENGFFLSWDKSNWVKRSEWETE